MNSQRRNPFAESEGVAPAIAFSVKPRRGTTTAPEHIEQLARDNDFPSRQASPAGSENSPVPRKKRVHRTGRNQQFNLKASAETIERFNNLADKKKVTLGELLELAVDALEKSSVD